MDEYYLQGSLKTAIRRGSRETPPSDPIFCYGTLRRAGEAPSISPQGGGLSVFPNPVGDVLNIVGQDIAKVTVSNVPGQVRFTTPFPLLKTGVLHVVMAPFASGVYVVEVTDGDGVRRVVKVVKE